MSILVCFIYIRKRIRLHTLLQQKVKTIIDFQNQAGTVQNHLNTIHWWLDPYLREFLQQNWEFDVCLRLRHISLIWGHFYPRAQGPAWDLFSAHLWSYRSRGVSVYLWIINALLNYPLLSAVYRSPATKLLTWTEIQIYYFSRTPSFFPLQCS